MPAEEQSRDAPVLASGVIGAADEPMTRTIAINLDEEVRAAVRRAAFPAFSTELRDALVAKAKAEVAAGTPPPVGPDKSLIDHLAVDLIELCANVVAHKTRRVEEAADDVKARRDRLAGMSMPMSMFARVLWSLVILALALVIALAVGAKLGVSIDAFILGPVVESVYGESSAKLSLVLSLRLGILIAVGLLVSQAVITVLAPRFIGLWVKVGFLVVDLIFAVAFFYLRTGSGASGQGLAFSLLEASLSVGLAVVLFVAAACLGANDQNHELRVIAEAELIVARDELAERIADRDAEAKLLQEQILVLEKRDMANRMQSKHEELAAATVHAAYVVETSALIGEAGGMPSDQTLNDSVRSYANHQVHDLGLTNGHNRNGGTHVD